MKETGKLTIGLGFTCLLAAAVLAIANLVTAAPRQRALNRERQENLRLILPDFSNDPIQDASAVPVTDRQGRPAGTVTFYVAKGGNGDSDVVALAGEASSSRGFGGDVTVMAGLKPDGEILNVIVISHSETPGLGTRVTDRTRTRYIWEAFAAAPENDLPPSPYLDQYRDRNARNIGADTFGVVTGKDELGPTSVLAVSGATVSSRAVADAINLICRAFDAHRSDLLPARQAP